VVDVFSLAAERLGMRDALCALGVSPSVMGGMS
jgi:hypothetical protein